MTFTPDSLKRAKGKVEISRLNNSPLTVDFGEHGTDTIRNIDLSGCILDGLQFYDIDFKFCDLVDVRASNCTFEECRFISCNLNRAFFDYARFTGCRFIRSSILRASFIGAEFDSTQFEYCDLEDSHFNQAIFPDTTLEMCNLKSTSWRGCNLTHDMFRTGCELGRVPLVGATFGHSALSGHTPILELSPLGSCYRTLRAWNTIHGIYFSTGCFTGSAAEFKEAVLEKHPDGVHRTLYLLAIDLAEAKWTKENSNAN